MATPEQIDAITKHFVIAALWADCQEGTRPRVGLASRANARAMVVGFVHAYPALLAEALERESEGYGMHPDCGKARALGAFGHDLWLTAQGHGCGFWGRDELDEGELGRRLTDAVHAYFGHGIDHDQFGGWFYIHAKT